MRANYETTTEAESSGLLRSVLILLLVICACSVLLLTAVSAHSKVLLRHPAQRNLSPRPSAIPHESSAPEKLENVALSDVNGHRVFSTAALIEQDLERSTSYTVRVQVANGDEQLIPVTAPPGGLQLEVRDMTGDNVRNDLVLRPALFHWPLIVLLNDGHDHFKAVITADLPSNVDSRRQASGSQEIPVVAAFRASSSKTGLEANGRQILALTLQRGFLPPLAQRVPSQDGYRSVLGRAPPAFGTRA